MTIRHDTLRLPIFLCAAALFLAGCSKSAEESGEPVKTKTADDVATVEGLARSVVSTLVEDDAGRFEQTAVPSEEMLREFLRSNAKPQPYRRLDHRIWNEVLLEDVSNRYPAMRNQVLQSWSRVRRRLQAAGVEFQSLEVDSIDQTPERESAVITANNVRIKLAAGSKRFTLTLDHCLLIDEKWQVVGELQLTGERDDRSTARRR